MVEKEQIEIDVLTFLLTTLRITNMIGFIPLFYLFACGNTNMILLRFFQGIQPPSIERVEKKVSLKEWRREKKNISYSLDRLCILCAVRISLGAPLFRFTIYFRLPRDLHSVRPNPEIFYDRLFSTYSKRNSAVLFPSIPNARILLFVYWNSFRKHENRNHTHTHIKTESKNQVHEIMIAFGLNPL